MKLPDATESDVQPLSGTFPADEQPAGTKQELKGIAILGSNPVTKQDAPYDDPDWLIWACSPDNSPFGYSPHRSAPKRLDRWYEIHVPIADKTRPYAYLRWLETLECPVFMRDADALKSGFYPNAKPFPVREVEERFGPFVWTSSIAFILAHAILECEAQKIPALGLWGIMQAAKNEYTYQKPALQQLIWEATKAGLKIYAPEESRLFERPPEDF